MERNSLASKLLDWYKKQGRILPFRNEKDSYKIWISEIMSQQTRIEAMLNHYKNFIQTYPDMETLANSDEESLLKNWQGLGYYNRAKNLRKTAQICMEKFSGKLPHSKKELTSLPGIGDYTASAIRSFAYGDKEVALDGNGIRVFSRITASDSDYSQKKNKETLKEKIALLMPEGKSADFNQAIMDLASSICLPKAPKCYECPLNGECIAFKLGDPSIYPIKKQKKQRLEERLSFYVPLYFEKDENNHLQAWTYLEKREEKDVLQGLYGFKQALPKGLSYKNILVERDIARYWHLFTHKAWFIQGKLILVDAKTDEFITIEQADTLPLPSAFQPLWKALLENAAVEKEQREKEIRDKKEEKEIIDKREVKETEEIVENDKKESADSQTASDQTEQPSLNAKAKSQNQNIDPDGKEKAEKEL